MKSGLILPKRHLGFDYLVELYDAQGRLQKRELARNLMPTEGINYLLSAGFGGGAQSTAWYLGLYATNYTPVITDTAATFPTNAGEFTNYSAATRVVWTPGSVSGGSMDNSASLASFTFTGAGTIYGGFLSSSSGKSAGSGVLGSAVLFTSPNTVTSGMTLTLTSGIALTN